MIIIDNLQDKFYSSIAEYYAEIFPFKPEQLAFTEKEMGPLAEKSILEVGCASGELAWNLAESGATVTAIDLNKPLLAMARENRGHERVKYQWANMLHIARLFGRSKFDGVVCYGNTLVHLMNPMQMRDFFSGVRTVLKPGGIFLLQVLNYDKIFDEKPESLPLIETEKIRFERKYTYEEGTREIIFNTSLYIKEAGETIENQTELLGIPADDLTMLLDVAGMENIETYGGFSGQPLSNETLPLVIKGTKPR